MTTREMLLVLGLALRDHATPEQAAHLASGLRELADELQAASESAATADGPMAAVGLEMIAEDCVQIAQRVRAGEYQEADAQRLRTLGRRLQAAAVVLLTLKQKQEPGGRAT